jgi:hypothetical protein
MASTLQVYNNLLKKHQPWQAMEDKVKRSDFFLKKVKVKKDFVEDEMSIPFITAGHSNVRAGKLTPINEITRGAGEVGVLKDEDLLELWGTIKINEKDIRKHKSAEASFKAMFPQKINGLMETMKEQVSVMFLQDGSLASVSAYGAGAGDGTDGEIIVNRPERFQPRQRIDLSDGVTTLNGYIRIVDMEKNSLTIYDAEEGGAVVDLSVAGAGFTAAADIKIYVYDHGQVSHDSLRDMLLPASKGGKSTLHGVEKLSSPILQAHYEDASGWTASTILKNVFDFSRKVKQKGKVQQSSVVVPYFVFNDLVLKAQENKRYMAGEVEAGYGFDKVTIRGAGGSMEIYGVFDLTDTGYIMDWEHLYLCSPEMFSTNRELGAEPFERVRTEDGHIYILDVCFRGGLAIRKASGFGIIDNLDYGA